MQSTEQLSKLSDEVFQYLHSAGLKAGATEYYLVLASLHHYPQIAKMCILAGANIHALVPPEMNNYPDAIGKTAVMIAKDNHYTDIETLLSEAANSNTHIIGTAPVPPETVALSPVNEQVEINRYIRQYHRTLDFSSDSQNAWNLIINLIDAWEFDQNTPKNESTLPTTRKSLIRRLMTTGGSRLHRLLHAAIEGNNILIAQLCIDAKADLDKREHDNAYNLPSIHLATLKGHLSLVALFLDRGADVNALCPYKRTPLMIAAATRRLDMIAYLMNRGAKPNLFNTAGVEAIDMVPIPDYVQSRAMTVKAAQLRMTPGNKRYSEKYTELKNNYKTLKNDNRCYQYLSSIIKNRQDAINQWAASKSTPEGQIQLTAFYNELVQFLQLPENKKEQYAYTLLKIATHYRYPELARVAKMICDQQEPQRMVLRLSSSPPPDPNNNNNANGNKMN